MGDVVQFTPRPRTSTEEDAERDQWLREQVEQIRARYAAERAAGKTDLCDTEAEEIAIVERLAASGLWKPAF